MCEKNSAVNQSIVLIVKYCSQHECPTTGNKVNKLWYINIHSSPGLPHVINRTTIEPVAQAGDVVSFKYFPPSLSTYHPKSYHFPKYTGSHLIDVLT